MFLPAMVGHGLGGDGGGPVWSAVFYWSPQGSLSSLVYPQVAYEAEYGSISGVGCYAEITFCLSGEA